MTKNNNILLIWPDRDKGFYDFDPVGLIIGQKTLFFPLPLIYVAAALGEEWNYTLIDEGVEPVSDKEIENADFYLISVNILQRFAADALIKRLLPQNKPIIIGGPLISTIDHLFDHPLISKVYGEIEANCHGYSSTVAELLSDDMKNGTLKKEYHSQGHPDLKQFSPPRYDLVKKSGYFALSMQTSRGCPHHCDFCQQFVLYGRHRRKTTDQVLKELDLLLELGQNVTVIITDDNLMGEINNPDEKRIFIDLLLAIKEWQVQHNFPFDFLTQCSLDLTDHEDVIKLMSSIGLNIMFIGIESVDDDALASVHKSQNRNMNIIDRIRLLQNYGIGIYGGVIIGFDNESPETIQKQIDFVKNSNIPVVSPTMIMGLKGTVHFKSLKKEQRICEDPEVITKALWTNVIPLQHPRIIYNYYLRYLEEIYEPSAFFTRCLKWIKNWNDAYVIPGKKGSLPSNVRIKRIFRSTLFQGILASYRLEYWKYILKSLFYFFNDYNRLSLALYLAYIFPMTYQSTRNVRNFVKDLPSELIEEWNKRTQSVPMSH